MTKRLKSLISVAVTMIMVLTIALVVPTKIQAAEMTFSGTVSDATTADKIYLSTSGGTVEIKIDSDTDTSNAKFILPGNSLTAYCYRASDEYWHASKLVGTTSAGKVSVDKSSQATVKGTIAKGTSEELLYLVVDNGTMQIKIDDDTDVSGVKIMIIGKTVQVVCARGSDAYMHALSITDVGGSYLTSTSSSSSSSNGGVTGTVEKGTTSSILYLSTSGGTMEFVLDLATDASGCRVLMPGESITVNFYRGADAWNHTSKIVNNSSKAAAEVTLDANSKITVSGTVSYETNENTLYLATSGGTMQIKLDSATNFSRCPVILPERNIQVVCERGSDEYYHAVSIVAN